MSAGWCRLAGVGHEVQWSARSPHAAHAAHAAHAPRAAHAAHAAHAALEGILHTLDSSNY